MQPSDLDTRIRKHIVYFSQNKDHVGKNEYDSTSKRKVEQFDRRIRKRFSQNEKVFLSHFESYATNMKLNG